MEIIYWEKENLPKFEKEFHENLHLKRSKGSYVKTQKKNGNLKYFDFIKKNYKIHGRVLDLAGGSGYLTSALSKIENVTEVYLLEQGTNCLKYLVPKVLESTKANKNKIKLINGSFNNIKLENYFDFVFVFGGLHHSSKLRLTTDNINKCLKKNGMLFAKEPVAHYLTPTQFYVKDLPRRTNKKTGEIRNDNFYRLGEYCTAFYQSKLEPIKMVQLDGKSPLFNIKIGKCKGIYDCIRTFVFACKKTNTIKEIDECNWERW